MEDSRYRYKKINVIKAIVENDNNQTLLVKEPETNEWMPGHWGLPGGKPLRKESLYEAFKRKMKEELGVDLEPLGLYRIEELLLDERTVLMFHAVAKLEGEVSFSGEAQEVKWMGIEEIKKMDVAEFTEFFNKKLLLDYLSGDKDVVDFDNIETQQYFDMDENEAYRRWWESGKKK